MAENEKLPASTRCTLKGAKFRIEIKANARPHLPSASIERDAE